MGYCIEMYGAEFVIKANKADAALAAIKALDPEKDGGGGGSWGGGRKTEVWFSWVTTSEYKEAKTLGEAMGAWRWGLSIGDSGDWNVLEFTGEKLGDDGILFNAIAPYVEPGSYIECQGEDGYHWRWVFDGKTMNEIAAKVTWEE